MLSACPCNKNTLIESEPRDLTVVHGSVLTACHSIGVVLELSLIGPQCHAVDAFAPSIFLMALEENLKTRSWCGRRPDIPLKPSLSQPLAWSRVTRS